jgi:hypothetical protein
MSDSDLGSRIDLGLTDRHRKNYGIPEQRPLRIGFGRRGGALDLLRGSTVDNLAPNIVSFVNLFCFYCVTVKSIQADRAFDTAVLPDPRVH